MSRPRAHNTCGDPGGLRLIAELLVQTDRVVVPVAAFHVDSSLCERVEDFSVKYLIAKPDVEGLHEAILLRAPGHVVGGLRPHCGDPLRDRLGDEFGSIIGADMARDAPKDKQIRRYIDDVG